MDLLERYLAAIQRHLPAGKADDIIAELRDDLLTRVEMCEAKLGRPLDKSKMEALLHQFGRPMLVAARYREHQHLIGPELFPHYLAAMNAVLAIVVLVTTVLAGVDMAFGSRNLWQAVSQAVGGIAGSALSAFAIVTLIFAIIERRGWTKRAADWKVDELPSLDDLTRDSRRDAPFEIVAGTLFLLWWVGVIPFPPQIWHQFAMTAAPIWTELFWPITLLLSARLVMSVLGLMPSRFAPLRHALAVATTIGGLAIIVLLFQAGHWVEVVPGTAGADEASQIEASLNLALRLALVVCAIMWTLGGLGGLYKWWQRRRVRAVA